MYKILLAPAAMIFALTMLVSNVWAQTIDVADNSLNTIVITSSRVEELKREVTSNITIYDEQTIDMASGQTLADFMEQQGFYTKDYASDNLSNVGIRGFKTETHGMDILGHVLVLFNGYRTANGNLDKISVLNVGRIEVIRGPAAMQYGPAAMGGVINIITKRGEGPLTGRVEVGMGSFNRYDAGLTFSGSSGPVDYSFGYQFMKHDDYSLPDGTVYVNTRTPNRSTGDLDLGYTFADNHRIGINLSYFEYYHSGLATGFTYPPDINDIGNKSNYNLNLNYEGHTDDDQFIWSVKYTFGNDKDFWLYSSYGGAEYYNDIDFKHIQGQLTWDRSIFQLTGGFDYLKYDWIRDPNTAPENQDYTDIGAFLIGKLRLLEDSLIFTAGVRQDWYEVNVVSQAGAVHTAKHQRLTPSVGVAYSPVDWLKLRANYSEAFIVPQGNTLAADFYSLDYDTGTMIHYVGNPNLKPESSKAYEIGFDISYSTLNLSMTYFTNHLVNMISSYTVDAATVSYKNRGSSQVDGLELNLDFDIGQYYDLEFSLKPYINLTHMTKYEDGDTGQKIGNIPDNIIAYGVAFDYPNWDFSTTFNVTYTGDVVDSYSGRPIPSYSLVTWTLRKKLIDLPHGKLDLRVNINNLLNEYYQSSLNYPGAGRNFYVGLHYVF
ncbi:MAG: TonB-dependent receptor [Deltaproteobacteria bacterium]|jgi:vitamin B12 transporter|nr:TonB-dependent receptor [Deltaproteobacteria bacterium]